MPTYYPDDLTRGMMELYGQVDWPTIGDQEDTQPMGSVPLPPISDEDLSDVECARDFFKAGTCSAKNPVRDGPFLRCWWCCFEWVA